MFDTVFTMKRLHAVLLAFAVAASCGGPQEPAGFGEECFRDDDCQTGLVCVGIESPSDRICTNQVNGLVSMVPGPEAPPEGGAPGAAGAPAGGAPDAAGGAPPVVVAGSGPVAGSAGTAGGGGSAGSAGGGGSAGTAGGGGSAGSAGGGGTAGTSAEAGVGGA